MSRTLGVPVLPFVAVLASLAALHSADPPVVAPAPRAADALQARFTAKVQPFLSRYCFGCHGPKKQAASLDLSRDATPATIIKNAKHWELVLERLHAREMPPEEATKQPTAEERAEVVAWLRELRAREAEKHAGDPGIVLARRLSNAEYDYTIRDLTGVDIRPARDFPVDPANQAGFDNSGESLAMSPALLNKYLLAARDVADHMFLNASGFAFAPHKILVETDRDRYCIQQIVDFYDRQNTDYADYFKAAWTYKHRAALGTPKATLADVAGRMKVSAKYLAMIWQALETPEEVGPLAKLQAMWRSLPVPKRDQPDLAGDRANRMRDFVVRMRKDTSLVFASPEVKGLSVRTQPLMNWKLRAYATHRRDFDRATLGVEV